MNTMLVLLTPDQIRALIALVGPAVSAQTDPERGVLYEAERALDYALLLWERNHE